MVNIKDFFQKHFTNPTERLNSSGLVMTNKDK